MMTAFTTGSLCNELVTSSKLNNVTSMMTPGGIRHIESVCNTTNLPTFQTVFFGIEIQPSSTPSSLSSTTPATNLIPPKPQLVTTSFIGFLSIVLLIGFLRFYLDVISMFSMKKNLKCCKYDILVVFDDVHEAILENISHEDIALYRRTRIEMDDQILGWVMNDTPHALEERYEVKFFDTYDLLNKSGGDVNEYITEKKRVKSYFHVSDLQVGMIMRVKPPNSTHINAIYRSDSQSITEISSFMVQQNIKEQSGYDYVEEQKGYEKRTEQSGVENKKVESDLVVDFQGYSLMSYPQDDSLIATEAA